MCKKIFRKFMVINLMLIMLLLNFTFLNNDEVKAAIFTEDDYPYNIVFTQISAGGDNTCAIDDKGYLYVWGKYSTVPAAVKQESKFIEISAGIDYILAIDDKYNLWGWGSNTYGQLGDGTSTETTIPVKIQSGTKFKKVSAGDKHSAAIDENGNLWTWGDNTHGQLGDNTTNSSTSPIMIMSGTEFKEVSVGLYHSVAIDIDGNLYSWGLAKSVGNQTTTDEKSPVKILEDVQFSKISTTGTFTGTYNASNNDVADPEEHLYIHTLAIDSEGRLWSWGDNDYGQIGNGTQVDQSIPTVIIAEHQFEQISAGALYSLAVDINGNLWGWGGNHSAQISYDYKITVRPIPEIIETNIKMASAGKGIFCESYDFVDDTISSFAIDGNNVLYGWGFAGTSWGTQDWLYALGVNCDDIETVNTTREGIVYDDYLDIDRMTAYGIYLVKEAIKITNPTTYYTVTFMNGEEKAKEEKVLNGENATAPTLTKEGYTLSWDKEFTNVTSDLTVNAIWTPNTNTAYKVEHYKQNTSLNGYEKVDTEEKTGTTGALAVATKKTYEGFTENTSHSERLAQANVLGDGSLVLKLYYDRNSYTVTLNANDGTINAGNISNYKYGVGATLPTNVTKQGYTFAGWYNNEGLTGEAVTSIGTSETGNKTYYAKWTASTNTAYKVEHYKQNTNLNGYEKADTENKTGTTESQVTATAKTYEGFTENTSHIERLAQANVLADGSLVLKLYYDRNNYTVTLNANGGTINAGSISNYKYGVGETLPTNVTKQGYTFAGWYNNEGLTGNAVTSIGTSETGNKTYYAKWTANTNTPYKVEHYLRTTDTEVEGYELRDTEEKTGTTDTTATAVAKTYEGFTENTSHRDRIPTGNVEADGSLVLKLYYNRNSYNITYELNGGTASSELTSTYTYGKELILSNRVTKPGFEFAGWYDNEELTGEPVANIGTQETGNKTYYAKWTQNEFTVTFKNGQEIAKTQVVSKGESATAPNLTKEGYTLSWDKEFSNVTKDLTVNAVWTINKYTVIFKNEEETAKEETVSHGSNATAPELTKEGYTLSWDKAFNNITRDLTVNAVWTINQYTVTFKNGENVEKTETVNYGSGATAPSLTKAGYTLSWDKDFNNVTRDLTVNAVWTANTNTAYKVEHYLRTTDTEVEGYDLFETENKAGTTDEEVTAVAKEYEGFTENTSYKGRVPSGTVLADGSLVLKLYYNRNSYNITYELNGGTASSTLTNIYTYGKGLILSNRVTKQGCVFVGWYSNGELTGETVTRIGTNEIGNKTYYAKWVEEQQYYITSENHSINEEEKQITKVSPDTNALTLINNISTNGTAKVLNLKGEEVPGDALVGTGYKIQVDFNGTKHEYEIAVRGDLDGNGKVTITDLSTLNQIVVDSLKVQGVRKKAADIDYNNKITITDLSMMNQAIVGGKQL